MKNPKAKNDLTAPQGDYSPTFLDERSSHSHEIEV
jgi:hypothetical protein